MSQPNYFANDFDGKVRPKSILQPLVKREYVDHPQHYGGADNPFEHVKVAMAWNLGPFLYQCTKYICRAGKKDPNKYVEELKKAQWFLQQEIDRQYDLKLKGGKP